MADDSPDNRALIRAYLKKTPYRLEEAEDGQQAIDKFTAGNFDLVLMDIQMPIVDGYEATSTIRVWELANGRRRTPIVALTASALEEAVHRTQGRRMRRARDQAGHKIDTARGDSRRGQ